MKLNKRFFKWLGAALGVAVIGCGCFMVYSIFFKTDPVLQEQLLEQFGDDFFYNFDLESVLGADHEGEEETEEDAAVTKKIETEEEREDPGFTEDAGSSSGKPDTPADDQKEGSPPPPAPSPPPSPPPVTEDSIVAKYEQRFFALEAIALERLEQLFDAAYDEYRQKKEDGTLNTVELANKYTTAGRMLENNIDSAFYALLDELKSELIKHDLSTAITKDIQNQYLEAKAAKRKELLGRIN